MMTVDWWTIALQAANFAVLVWLLQRFLYRPVLRVVDGRRDEIEAGYAAAAAAVEAAEASRRAAEAERARFPEERAAALKAATAEAEQAAAARLAQAEHEAAALLGEARRRLDEERAAAQLELRGLAVDLAAEFAGRLIDGIPVERRSDLWLHRVEVHLAAMPAAQREELLAGRAAGRHVEVVTDAPLPDPARAAWTAGLRRSFGSDLDVAFAADPSLLAGADLHFPNAILRFSWQSALDAIRSEPAPGRAAASAESGRVHAG